jgi:hypothetical protein
MAGTWGLWGHCGEEPAQNKAKQLSAQNYHPLLHNIPMSPHQDIRTGRVSAHAGQDPPSQVSLREFDTCVASVPQIVPQVRGPDLLSALPQV